MKTSKKEIIDLIKAWIAISIAFSILGKQIIPENSYLILFLISSLTVGTGFLLHELAHKIIAQKYGYLAEFRSFDAMLIIAILFSFLGFIFAAPGAVIIPGHVDTKKNGKISLAGPLTNLILAIIFLIVVYFFPQGIINYIGVYGFKVNTWLALFNMIPVWNFDGKKVFVWNKTIYFIFVFIIFILLFIT